MADGHRHTMMPPIECI